MLSCEYRKLNGKFHVEQPILTQVACGDAFVDGGEAREQKNGVGPKSGPVCEIVFGPRPILILSGIPTTLLSPVTQMTREKVMGKCLVARFSQVTTQQPPG